MTTHTSIARVLEHWDGLEGAAVEPLGTGLINETYRIRADRRELVLQRLSPIFDPRIHQNIRAVTLCLGRAGIATPVLVETRTREAYLELPGLGVFRVMTYVEGASFDSLRAPAQARSAGELVGRVHAALDGLHHEFVGLRIGVHDTAGHLERLREAVAARSGHRLAAAVAPLALDILARASSLAPPPSLPDRICHGDLKANNVRFAGREGSASERAICLVDLDTLGPLPLAYELGDAFRSWCNRAGEDDTEAALDLDLLEASVEGYLEGLGRDLGEAERRALVAGPEWVSLELAARFARDALEESYFGWDPARYGSRGEHNLVRARGQWSLHEACVASRPRRAQLLEVRP